MAGGNALLAGMWELSTLIVLDSRGIYVRTYFYKHIYDEIGLFRISCMSALQQYLGTVGSF